MSTVNAGRFGSGPVRATAATRQQLGGARMMAGNLPVVPSRASLSASGRAASPSTVRNGSERFFGSVHNTASRPQSFQQQTASLRQTMQQGHVGAVPAGGRPGGGESVARGAGTMQKPGAGTFSNREAGNTGTRSLGNPSSAENGNRGVSRPFTPPSARASGSPSMGSANRGTESRTFENSGSRAPESPASSNRSSGSPSQGGFRPFTPPPNSSASRSGSGASSTERGSSGTYWNRTAPSTMGSRGYGAPSGSASRPQLDMRQPIVRSPSYGGFGGGRVPSYGGSHGAPGRAPSYGGGGHVSAPSGGHSSGGGHPSGGGSHSSGGGGHASGGGHSGGGHR